MKQMKTADRKIAEKRIRKELQEVGKDKENENNFFLQPVIEYNVFECQGIIYGFDNTPFAGGKFVVEMLFSDDYPFESPRVRFLTKIYHPNIDADGYFFLNILNEDWHFSFNIRLILQSIQQFLYDQNFDNPVNLQIGQQYKKNRDIYNSIAREWTQKYAS